MFKKLSALGVTLALIVTMVSGFSTFAYSSDCGRGSATRAFVYSANNQIRGCQGNYSHSGDERADARKILMAQRLVDSANDRILDMVERTMNSQNPDLDKLVSCTNAIALRTIDAAAKLGVTVVCEYQTFEINGQIVLIDPLKIISR